MILSFSKEKWVADTISGRKKHTLRKDPHGRWHAGRKIHFWKDNPRNVNNHPFTFGEGVVKRTAIVNIYPGALIIMFEDAQGIIVINEDYQLDQFAKDDGFNDWEELKTWFTEGGLYKLIIWDYAQCRFTFQQIKDVNDAFNFSIRLKNTIKELDKLPHKPI